MTIVHTLGSPKLHLANENSANTYCAYFLVMRQIYAMILYEGEDMNTQYIKMSESVISNIVLLFIKH
jgi:hypothetical protein